jgi:hypothetical protein
MTTYEQLMNIDLAARYWPGESVKPASVETIDGVEYHVEYRLTNRKCYDGMATPTACYKINGKRVSRATYYDVGQ